MKTLTEQVIRLGHRTLATITGALEGNDRASERLRGIKVAMFEAGIPAANLSVVETTYGIFEGGAALDQLMEQSVPPSVVICGNDILAVGAIAKAKERGLNVPEDLSVTGFDDIEIAKISTPPLTTVHVPRRRMGREAARLLIGLVSAEPEAEQCLIETSLRMRGSLAQLQNR